jgi:diphthine-ammonia ligase
VNAMQAVSSWSGGKDSCLACYRAMKDGHTMKYLLNFVSRKSLRCCFHGIDQDLIKLQADAIGIPLVQRAVSDDMKEYEKEFKAAVSELKDIQAMVFGDIYLDEHKEWVSRVCNDLGVACIEPLWNKSPAALVEEFIDLGFTAIVVSCQADKFGKDFIGRNVDRNLLRELTVKNICPCGENGEFHTFVVDGPIFRKRIEILKSEPVIKEGFWRHWFLDIKEYQGVHK